MTDKVQNTMNFKNLKRNYMNNKVRFCNFFDKGGFGSIEMHSDVAHLLGVSPIRYIRTKDDFWNFYLHELSYYVSALEAKYGIYISRERLIRSMMFLLNGLVYKFATRDIFEMNKRGCYVYATDKYYRGIGG